MEWTLLDADATARAPAAWEDGRLLLAPEALANSLGWRLEPEGLCRGEVCIPVRDRAALLVGDRIDLGALARLQARPLALDAEERVAVIGAGAAERAQRLASGLAPDFTLPDLQGRLHSLSEHRGRKVLLIVYASW